ncbi:hypothetical protein T4A_4964 [Trichinella pseudospiralis]|uniref:Uncharacterized protein n=1 Tax=Trichinella pseudospiralis TaxID=6337 RepID=A0A0V1EHU7_TRIPS|nr:hypothetical protein T4A_4964 [Trichinella pseudospiralis]
MSLYSLLTGIASSETFIEDRPRRNTTPTTIDQPGSVNQCDLIVVYPRGASSFKIPQYSPAGTGSTVPPPDGHLMDKCLPSAPDGRCPSLRSWLQHDQGTHLSGPYAQFGAWLIWPHYRENKTVS